MHELRIQVNQHSEHIHLAHVNISSCRCHTHILFMINIIFRSINIAIANYPLIFGACDDAFFWCAPAASADQFHRRTWSVPVAKAFLLFPSSTHRWPRPRHCHLAVVDGLSADWPSRTCKKPSALSTNFVQNVSKHTQNHDNFVPCTSYHIQYFVLDSNIENHGLRSRPSKY